MTTYQVYWIAPNPAFPPRPCKGYEYPSFGQAEAAANFLNDTSRGASGYYIVKERGQ